VTTTLSVYGHLFDGTDEKLDAILEATRNRGGGEDQLRTSAPGRESGAPERAPEQPLHSGP